MKKVRLLFVFILLTAAVLCCCACSGEENEWIPEVQGSCVMQMPEYEDIEGGISVEKYTSFKSFKNSALADYNFRSAVTAKEERYSPVFFKTRDLAVIKFNKPESGIDYTVIDAAVEGNDCTVKLLAVSDINLTGNENATYYCFLETEKDISNWNITLEITEEIAFGGRMFFYVDKHGMPYLFEDESAPVMFKITDPLGAEDFVENDPVLDKWIIVSHVVKALCSEEHLSDSALLLVRVPSQHLEDLTATADNGAVEITGVKTNHYMWSWEDDDLCSALIMLYVPKDFAPESARRTTYTEYEDDNDNVPVIGEYVLTETAVITGSLTRYDFAEEQ